MDSKKILNGPERGGAGVNALLVLMVLLLIGNAGLNYIPVAYNGASFKEAMDSAVVKGLATSGSMKPMDVVKSHVERAMADNGVPADAVVDIKATNGVVTAHAAYTQDVDILPFGIYRYKYEFNHFANPTGYLSSTQSTSTKK